MPSRKRNKGKERKAKKAEMIEIKRAGIRSMWMGWARGENVLDSGRVITQCNHGCDLNIPDDNHPVTRFMDALNTVDNLADTFVTHLAVWNDDRHRKMTRDLMLGSGTTMTLSNKVNVLRVSNMACVIMVLENYGGSGDIDSTINSRVVVTKIRDLGVGNGGSGSLRDVLKFYRKRTTCKCLKERHLHARQTLPKLGVCRYCTEFKERSSLMVCSRCRIDHYCSRECQVADWPSHKRECVTCARVQKEQFMDSDSK